MLKEIEYREVIQIRSAKKTIGSAPLEVVCNDGEIYFIKTTVPTHPPFPELINELFCNYLCQSFGLEAAIPRLITLPKIVVDSFLSEGNSLDTLNPQRDYIKNAFIPLKMVFHNFLED